MIQALLAAFILLRRLFDLLHSHAHTFTYSTTAGAASANADVDALALEVRNERLSNRFHKNQNYLFLVPL